MEKQARVREIKLNIEDEFVLNLVTYFTQEENYVFIGNENEIWLENLTHPKIQLIYINAQKKMTAVHANYIIHKAEIISKQMKRKFLMPKIQTLILNTSEFDDNIESHPSQQIPIINIQNAERAHLHDRLNYFFPKLAKFNLNTSMSEIVMKLQAETRRRATNEVHMAKLKIMPVVNNTYVTLLVLFFAYLWFRTRVLPADFVAIHYGATYNPLIAAGEYWRLIVAAFMHLDLMHLVFNAVFIYRFGAMVESVLGKGRMIFVILVSAVTASLFGFALSTNFSLGASGVAYGFIGVTVFLAFEMRKTFMPMLRQIIIPMLVISTVFSLFVPNIDHFGHLGGFVGGFLAATIVGVPKIKLFVTRSVVTAVTLVVLISGLWVNGVRLTENHNFDRINRDLIFQYIELGQIDRAMQLADIFFGEVE